MVNYVTNARKNTATENDKENVATENSRENTIYWRQ